MTSEHSGHEYSVALLGRTEDGREVRLKVPAGADTASNRERMEGMFRSQLGKGAGRYSFSLSSIGSDDGSLPMMSASAINAIRRELASRLDTMPVLSIPLPGSDKPRPTREDLQSSPVPYKEINDGVNMPAGTLSYKANVSNRTSREIYEQMGAGSVDDAFEISHRAKAELMRTKYCIRHELGLCPVHQGAPAPSGKLFLLNNGKRYALGFDCGKCEMTVLEG